MFTRFIFREFIDLLFLDLSLWGHAFQRRCYFNFKILTIELIKKGLILHQLNLQILISLIVVCYQVVNCFK